MIALSKSESSSCSKIFELCGRTRLNSLNARRRSASDSGLRFIIFNNLALLKLDPCFFGYEVFGVAKDL